MDNFLKLYSWESMLFCFMAPFVLIVPLTGLRLAYHLSFLLFPFMVILMLLIAMPWLFIPYLIVKSRFKNNKNIAFWAFYNGAVILGYIAFFVW